MKNNKEKSKIEEYLSNLRKAWKDPRKKAGIKLLGYLIFFIIFFILVAITNEIKRYDKPINNDKKTTTTTKITDNYNNKQENLLNNKHNINYEIINGADIYKINGNVENKELYGYLEYNDEIKKITIKNNLLYEIKQNEEILVDTHFNIKFINLEYIINLIKSNRAYIKDLDNIKTYEYSINIDDINTKIKVETNIDRIIKIDINYSDIIYNLNFDN